MYSMECKKCEKNSHYLIDIYIQNDFPLSFCDKHKNFKPNKLIVWLDRMYHIHYKFPKEYMRIHNVGYREGRYMYFRFKYSQKKLFNW